MNLLLRQSSFLKETDTDGDDATHQQNAIQNSLKTQISLELTSIENRKVPMKDEQLVYGNIELKNGHVIGTTPAMELNLEF